MGGRRQSDAAFSAHPLTDQVYSHLPLPVPVGYGGDGTKVLLLNRSPFISTYLSSAATPV